MTEETIQSAPPPRTRETIERELATKAWQDDTFMEELRTQPKMVIFKEYGVQIPDHVDLKVIEESSNTLYIRIPPNPSDVELSDEQLELVAGGEVAATAVISAIVGIIGITVGVAGISVGSVTATAQISISKGW